MTMKLTIFLLLLSVLLFPAAFAQKNYTFEDLLQEKVNITARPNATNFKESKDTSYTIYSGSSVELVIYTVYGDEYHPILNPNPTGMFLNKKHFNFYCGAERSIVKYLSQFLDIYEFEYLSRKYLCLFALREDCVTAGCRFNCFNVFDVTDPKNIMPYSFTSIFGKTTSFGDYNNDGKIDFLYAVPKAPESYLESEKDDKNANVLVMAFSFEKGEVNRMERKELGNPYYLYIRPLDEYIEKFRVVKHDWFVTLADSAGTSLKNSTYYPPYKPFDPKNDFLYDTKGHRVDKRNFIVYLGEYEELEGALDYCDDLKKEGFPEAFVRIDQYDRDLKFKILYGNYWGKEKAEQMKKTLEEKGHKGTVKNLRGNDF